MKIILSLILITASIYGAHAQGGNDPSKYTWYKNTYGQRLPRIWGDTVMQIPKDTIWSKDGLAMKNGVLYIGNGSKWTLAADAGIKPPDDFGHLYTAADIRDTTITIPGFCYLSPTYHGPYSVFYLPQFIGFRIRVRSVVQYVLPDDCSYGYWWHWDYSAGKLYVYGTAENGYDIVSGY